MKGDILSIVDAFATRDKLTRSRVAGGTLFRSFNRGNFIMARQTIWIVYFSLVASLFCAPGCKLLNKLRRFTPELRQIATTPYKPKGTVPISDRVVFLADNQLHNLYTTGVKGRSGKWGRYIPTAIRPVQLDLFGEHLVEYVINKADDEFIIHLGDACDLATTGEFTNFVEVMRQADNGWMMAPGNHDFFFYGFGHTMMDRWQQGAVNSGVPMTKNLFVRFYLAALIQQSHPSADSLAAYINKSLKQKLSDEERASLQYGKLVERLNDVSLEGHWQMSVEEFHQTEGSMVGVRWKIDDQKPWRSYLIQQAELTIKESPYHVRAIILDTCQYKRAPGVVPILRKNAGLTGYMLEDQMAAVEEWLDAEDASKVVWVLAGHHPFQALPKMHKDVRNKIKEWDRDYRIFLYLSGHTHRGGQYFIQNDLKKDDPDTPNDTYLPEINLGSILDWPQEYRTLQLFYFEGRKQFMYAAPSHHVYEIFDEEIEIKEEWDQFWAPKYGDKDYYMSFPELKDKDPFETELKLKDVLLNTYVRMLSRIPSSHVSLDASKIQPGETKLEGKDLTQQGLVYPAKVEGWISDRHVKRDMAHAINTNDSHVKNKLLIRLRKWDLQRAVEDEKRQENYRLFQAVMASRYDKMRNKKPGTSDWFMSFPKSSVLKD